MARPTKPTALKLAQGTFRKSRANPDEPNFELVKELPNPPEYLGRVGRALYNTVGLELTKKGILTSVSMPLFIQYCTQLVEANAAYQVYRKAPTVIRTRGEAVSPYFEIWQKCSALSLRMASELGITPASNSKVKAIESHEPSPLDKFFNL